MNTISIASVLVVLIGLVYPGNCIADIDWKDRELKLNAAPMAKDVDFNFRFENSGSKKIQIENLSASCGCTLLKPSKDVYRLGEFGFVGGTVSVNGQHGLSKIEIIVKGNEIDGEIRRPFTQTLVLEVTVPEIIKISPGVAVWKKNSEPSPKTIRFELHPPLLLPLKLKEINKKIFVGKLIEVEANKTYQLIVAPISTAETDTVTATVEGLDELGNSHKFYAHLLIR